MTKDHIFAYVYGVLHSPDYRERYAADLAKLLPRIPEVATGPMLSAPSPNQENGSSTCTSDMKTAEPYTLDESDSHRALLMGQNATAC